ncbi:acyltransferase family protein [Pseudomonas sp. BJa5]|uniref:acyltransferase family protein n=1 Tax=Pseudomonas sp. BJa5 TaxID=2936270 RepID=UPI00255A0FA0|nr:acyltransferase [Pseudomonas sp. BGr12]MDL2421825.1 acyltransferase [Pseudomonas sp. BGr12]
MSRLTQDQSQQLDSIRALAAFAVLLGHTYQTLLLPTLGSWFTVVVLVAQFAVMAFFVLSGFLIGKSACNNVRKHTVFSIGDYTKARVLRLYPPLIAALMLMLFLGLIAPHFFPSGSNALLPIEGVDFIRTGFVTSTADIWGALTFLNGFKVENPSANSPLWSLSLEAWYYVIAAAIFLWPGKKLLALVLVAVTAFVTHGNSLFFLLAPVWFSGFVLALIHQRHPAMSSRVYTWLFLVMSVALVAVTADALWRHPSGNEVVYEKINMFRVVSGLWFACFMAMLLGGKLRFSTCLHKHASYSYTLYVIHFPIMLFALGVFQVFAYGSSARSLMVSVGVVLVSLAVSWSLSRWVENKALLDALLRSAMRRAGSKKTA